MQPNQVTGASGSSISAILLAVDAARAARPRIALALATLVNVDGSSYRQPGARLLVNAESRVLAGAISGGCLEGDVAARAANVCATNAPVLLRYDLREDLETIWGFGAACDGIAHVLLEPLHNDAWLRDACALMQARKRPVLVTNFGDSRAESVQGMHTLVRSDARSEAYEEFIATALETGLPNVASLDDAANSHVLVEPLNAPVALHIIGAGRSAETFAIIAVALGWQVIVIDHREALLHELLLPPAATRMLRRAEDGLGELPRDSRTVVALLTHIFEVDAAWLAVLLPEPVAYVGVLGSRNRAARLLTQLTGEGVQVSPAMQERLFAPIGLDLGGETPESIALAGIAEMEAVLHARHGGFLRARQSAIHTRTPIPTELTTMVDATIAGCSLPVASNG